MSKMKVHIPKQWYVFVIDHPVTRKKSRQKIRGGRIGEVSFSSVTSVSEDAAVIGPSGKRINQVDQVVEAPDNVFNGSSALVVIRSFCRFAPLESDAPHCRKPEPLYFYNITSATCQPFYGGHCQRSRNRFRNVPDCLKVIFIINWYLFSVRSNFKTTTGAFTA